MTYLEWNPGPVLADRVACFWTSGLTPEPDGSETGTRPPDSAQAGKKAATSGPVTADAATGSGRSPQTGPVKRILPDGCMDIIWGREGVQVAGPDTHAHLAPVRPGACYVAVRFLPGGAGHTFGVPAEALTDLRIPLSDLWDDDIPWPEPPNTLDDLTRFRGVVAERLRADGPVADPAVPAMRHALAKGLPVAEVARGLGFSERTLRRRSRSAFGYGPKTLQRILRFQQALHHARRGSDLAWVAHECGYTDQAHFAGEVKDLAGVPVTQLR